MGIYEHLDNLNDIAVESGYESAQDEIDAYCDVHDLDSTDFILDFDGEVIIVDYVGE